MVNIKIKSNNHYSRNKLIYTLSFLFIISILALGIKRILYGLFKCINVFVQPKILLLSPIYMMLLRPIYTHSRSLKSYLLMSLVILVVLFGSYISKIILFSFIISRFMPVNNNIDSSFNSRIIRVVRIILISSLISWLLMHVIRIASYIIMCFMIYKFYLKIKEYKRVKEYKEQF